MKKMILASLVLFITLSFTGRELNKVGFTWQRAIAMEQKAESNVDWLKPPKDPDPPAVFPQVAPVDPYYRLQCWLDDWGETYTTGVGKNKKTAISNYSLQAEKAWKVQGATGEGVTIAILSTGVAYENWTDPVTGYEYKLHPDFTATDGVTFDTANARDFTVPHDTAKFYHATDAEGAGTHCAALIAANTNNTVGCAGLAYKAKILPIRVYGYNVEGFWSTPYMIEGINWAVQCNVDVMYIPGWGIGTTTDDTELYAAIVAAHNAGIVIICQPNGGIGSIATTVYPAAYEECIGVGGIRFDGEKIASGGFEGEWMDLVAPGGYVTYINNDPAQPSYLDQNFDGYNDYIYYQGFWNSRDANGNLIFTQNFSYLGLVRCYSSGAFVTAVAAMVLSHNKIAHNIELSPEQVYAALTTTAKLYGSNTGFTNVYGWGAVDAYGAVNYTP